MPFHKTKSPPTIHVILKASVIMTLSNLVAVGCKVGDDVEMMDLEDDLSLMN